jgi:hypothetical protein
MLRSVPRREQIAGNSEPVDYLLPQRHTARVTQGGVCARFLDSETEVDAGDSARGDPHAHAGLHLHRRWAARGAGKMRDEAPF